METLKTYLPFIIPVLVLQLALMAGALTHLLRHKKPRCLNKIVWAIIIICGELPGPVLYFIFGRPDD